MVQLLAACRTRLRLSPSCYYRHLVKDEVLRIAEDIEMDTTRLKQRLDRAIASEAQGAHPQLHLVESEAVGWLLSDRPFDPGSLLEYLRTVEADLARLRAGHQSGAAHHDIRHCMIEVAWTIRASWESVKKQGRIWRDEDMSLERVFAEQGSWICPSFIQLMIARDFNGEVEALLALPNTRYVSVVSRSMYARSLALATGRGAWCLAVPADRLSSMPAVAPRSFAAASPWFRPRTSW